MNVLCNLYPLGRGAYSGAPRTGVFRVVDQLARGLAASPECETSFHAVTDLWYSWRFYQEYLRGPHSHFAVPAWRVHTSRHLTGIRRWVSGTPSGSLYGRAVHYAPPRYTNVVERFLDRPDDRLLRKMDIYHSPFVPIPARIKRHRHLRRFTTVCDVIALSHPQFFDAGTVGTIRQLADGLDASDHVLCISEATRVDLLGHAPRLDPSRVRVTPLAAGPAFYPERDREKIAAVRARIGLPPDVPYFLSVCTLEPRKNLEAVIRAFARCKQEGGTDPQTRLVLVGGMGWKTERITAALEEARECQDAILLTGFIPDEALAALYSDALAFVYLSWLEGFGLPPLEAMQCGVPVICSNTTSLPEVVGDAGILLPPGDADGIAAAMHTLAVDESARRDLQGRALARAQLFSWERFIRQTIDAYHLAMDFSG